MAKRKLATYETLILPKLPNKCRLFDARYCFLEQQWQKVATWKEVKKHGL